MFFATGFRLLALALFVCAPAFASDVDELKAKREEVYQFTAKPTVRKNGREFLIEFESKAFCDATVAIEGADGKIVRHLVSGVLGDKAPAPFAANSLKQAVRWDGKNDQGKVIEHPDNLRVRVSLGLKPVFEKSLYSSPYKRLSSSVPLTHACPEGMLVYEGFGVDSLKLYDHDGKYLRTIYPFAADKLDKVKGLDWFDFPQGLRLPRKKGMFQQTLLTSGENGEMRVAAGMDSMAVSALCERGGRIMLAKFRLNRIDMDGTTGDMFLNGKAGGQAGTEDGAWRSIPEEAKTTVKVENLFLGNLGFHQNLQATPTSAALSPDGKWLYMAGYAWRKYQNNDTIHVVTRMPVDGSQDATIFLGKLTPSEHVAGGAGSGPGEFINAGSVDCDAQGRIYVTDYLNDRVQIFSPDGQHLKDIATERPAKVRIHRVSGDIFVFSLPIASHAMDDKGKVNQPCKLTRFGTFDDPALKTVYDLPLPNYVCPYWWADLASALIYSAELDSWSKELTVWIGRDIVWGSGKGLSPDQAGLLVLREKDGKLVEFLDFHKEAAKTLARTMACSHGIQKLAVNPVTGKLYVGEPETGPTTKDQNHLIEIDPDSGLTKVIDLPMQAIEFDFDLDGVLYLRNTDAVVRYVFPEMREIPWDYGDERSDIGSMSALRLPSTPPVCWHQSGFSVAPNGNVLVACAFRFPGSNDREQLSAAVMEQFKGSKPYLPPVYPGRLMGPTTASLHVWDKHGQPVSKDALAGMGQGDGVALDREGNIYVLHTPSRVLDGKKYFNEMTETLMKVKPNKAKLYSTNPGATVPLQPDSAPKRPPELANDTWADGVEWFYGGVGFAGFNTPFDGGGCACRFVRFSLDLFARSLVPEPYQYSVGIVDTNGNLILRVGRCGNSDGVGEETCLFHPCFVATQSDRRIFIADNGNQRIACVKIEYHASESVDLKTAMPSAR